SSVLFIQVYPSQGIGSVGRAPASEAGYEAGKRKNGRVEMLLGTTRRNCKIAASRRLHRHDTVVKCQRRRDVLGLAPKRLSRGKLAKSRANTGSEHYQRSELAFTQRYAPRRRGMASDVGPAAQQVVIDAGKLHDGRMAGGVLVESLDGNVHVQQQIALAVFAHQALHPEKRADARAARYRIDLVQTCARIQHQVSGGQLDRTRAVSVVHDQLATVVGIGVGKKQRGREV